jgi:hypothetical protein
VLRRLSESMRLKAGRLVFTRPLTLKPGYLRVTYERSHAGREGQGVFMAHTYFEEAGGNR